MGADDWFKAGKIDPANMLVGNLDLRDVLNRTKGLNGDAWITAESNNSTYLLTRAELLNLRKRIFEQFGRGPSDPLSISIDELFQQSGMTPTVRVDMPGEMVVEIGNMLREVKYKSAYRVLIVEPLDGSIAVWQRTPQVATPFPDELAAATPSDAAHDPYVAGSAYAPGFGASREEEPDLSDSPGLLGDESPLPEDTTAIDDGPPPENTYINAAIDKYKGGPLAVDSVY